MVRRLSPERLDRERMDVPVPAGGANGPTGWRGAADDVVAAFRAADPDAAMWAWGADKHARFWPRRMLHETTVHRADAELGARAGSGDRTPRLRSMGSTRCWRTCRTRFVSVLVSASCAATASCCTSTAPTPTASGRSASQPDGFTWGREHAKATVAVRATAPDLLLLLYGRCRPTDDRLERFGDDDLLGWWLERSAL